MGRPRGRISCRARAPVAQIDGGVDRPVARADDDACGAAVMAADHVARRHQELQSKRQEGKGEDHFPQPTAAGPPVLHRHPQNPRATVLGGLDARSPRNIPTVSEPPVHLGPDGPDARPRKTGQSRLDLALAVSAIFISGVSLYVAIEHGKTERDLVAANSWPFLRPEISNDFGPDHDLEIGVSNGGVGPAKVKSYQVFYLGAPVANPFRPCCAMLRPVDRPGGGEEADQQRLRYLEGGRSGAASRRSDHRLSAAAKIHRAPPRGPLRPRRCGC